MKKKSSFSSGHGIGKISETVFDNGLRVFVNEKKGAPIVSVQAWVKTGSIHEGDFLGSGLSHFLEHMVFQGTKKYPRQKISETVHSFGGDINAYTSFGSTVYYIEGPSKAFESSVDMLADIVSAPLFPKEKFASEKDVILRERDMYRDRPASVVSEKLWLNMYRTHPVRHPIIGYHEKIEKVNRQMMVDYYHRRYSPDRLFFVISGDVDAALAAKLVKDRLDNWPIGQLAEPILPEEPKQLCARASEYHFKDPLSRISIGYRIPDATHSDIPALDILSSIMGSSKSSRLESALQDEKELAINISSFNYTPYFCGLFGVAAICAPNKLEELQEAVFAEVEKVRQEKIEKSELEREMAQQVTDYIRSLRTNNGVARIIGNTVIGYGSPDYADKYLDDIAKVTRDDIQKVALKYLGRDSSTLVTLLPEKTNEISAKLKKNKELRPSPKPKLEKLPSGQKIISYVNNDLPLVDFCLILPGGVIKEIDANAGITRFIASALSTGTKKYTENELAALLDNNAIDLGISSGNNSLTLRFNCHKNKLDIAFSALESIIKEPTFPEKEFLREKSNIIDSLKSRKLNPQNAAEDKMCKLLYKKHPYSHPAAGFEKSVANLSKADLSEFYFSKCLVAQKAVFGIAGDIDAKKTNAKIQKLVNAVKWNNLPDKFDIPKPVFPRKPVLEKVKVPRKQAVVMFGMPACSILDDDNFIFDIFYPAFNGQTSRLFKSIRNESGLAYYTGLFSSRGIHDGILAFYAGTHPEATEEVLDHMEKERKKLIKKGLTQKEFDDAKACLFHSVAEQMEKIDALIFGSALSEYYGNGYKIPWERNEIYKNISLKMVNNTIKKYMDTLSTVAVTAGP